MGFIVDLLFNIFNALILLLPISPFDNMINQMTDVNVLGVVNWFIPFGPCLVLLELWLVCVGAYYIYKNIHKILDFYSKIKGLI